MPPKSTDPKAASMKGTAAAAPAEVDNHVISAWAMRELREDFVAPSVGEELAVELAHDLLERSSALYIDTLYDRLAVDYTAAALWEQMSSIVAVCNVQPDRDAVGETDAKVATDDESTVGNGSMIIPPISTSESGTAERQGSMTSAAIAPSATADSRQPPAKGAAKGSSAKTPKATKTPRSVRIAEANAPELTTPPALPAVAASEVPPVDAPPVEVVPAPTWQADPAPARVPCDRHTRHNIPMLRKKPPTPATTAPTPSESASPGSAGRRRRGPRSNASNGASDPNMLGGTLRGTLSDAGSSRPASRTSSASGGMRSSMRPSAQAQRRMSRAPPAATAANSGRRGSAGATAEPERQSTPQQEQPPQLTAEEQAVLAAAAADEQRKESVRRTHAQIASQLADTKALERGFVVDGPSARVVPLIPAEEMLSSAKKLAEPLKFNVPEPPAYPQPPNTAPAATPATQRVGGKPVDPKKNEAKRNALNARREDNYFVPDHTAVAMVQPVTPVGGVTVKDTDGAPRSTEMHVPRNKMTKADFNTASKAQQQQQQLNPDGSGTPQERAFEPIPKPGAPNTARRPSVAAKPEPKGTNTARPSAGASGDQANAAPTRPQPPSTAPQGVARRLPLTPASTKAGNQQAGSPVSRKAKGRSQAAANPSSARKPSVTAAAPSLARELLSDDL